MREEFRPAIQALQQDLAELERKATETKTTINRLCELAGAPPMYADVGSPGQTASLAAIRADTFYGKVLTTAAREYLEMRKSGGLGPCSPREIFEALRKGGFAFDTKNENNAITGVRNTMRKNSSIFHRLPNGEYGLLAWYPRAKAPRAQADADEPEDTQESEAATSGEEAAAA